jgi:heme/copper-type cytochrome/quinol oxidase subunit 3
VVKTVIRIAKVLIAIGKRLFATRNAFRHFDYRSKSGSRQAKMSLLIFVGLVLLASSVTIRLAKATITRRDADNLKLPDLDQLFTEV